MVADAKAMAGLAAEQAGGAYGSYEHAYQTNRETVVDLAGVIDVVEGLLAGKLPAVHGGLSRTVEYMNLGRRYIDDALAIAHQIGDTNHRPTNEAKVQLRYVSETHTHADTLAGYQGLEGIAAAMGQLLTAAEYLKQNRALLVDGDTALETMKDWSLVAMRSLQTVVETL